MNKMIFCGIDIGTTNTKGLVLDEKGNVLSSVSISNPVGCEDVFWYKHFIVVMDKFQSDGVFASSLIYCSVTSQGGSFVLVDDQLKPVSDMCLWTDSQSGNRYAGEYINEYGSDNFYSMSGWKANGWLPVFKLKGIDKNSYGKVAFVPDFIYGQLTGKMVTDITNAQITGLCNFHDKVWSEELTTWAGVDKSCLPEICDSLQILFHNIPTRWGKLNIVTSSHDQYAAMNAISLEKDKDIMLASGTAWVLNSRKTCVVSDMRTGMLHPGRDISADNYGNISVVGSNLGEGFNCLLSLLDIDCRQLDEFEPELKSTAFPTRVFNAAEYDYKTQKAVLIKRYMEWMAAVVKKHLVEHGFMEGLEEIVLTGGAAASNVLPQVLADVCGIKVKSINFPELTAYGAAKFAAQAAGVELEKSVDDVSSSHCYLPVNKELYEKWYDMQVRCL